MGGLCCCCPRRSSRGEYVSIPEIKSIPSQAMMVTSTNVLQSQELPAYNPSISVTQAPYLAPGTNIDLTRPAFAGIRVDQKYASYGYYDEKFIWISEDCRTLHMSQYQSKLKHHKEANLDVIVSIESLPPINLKQGKQENSSNSSSSNDNHHNNSNDPDDNDIYLTIKFRKGGAIDLRFKNKVEKNEFMKYLQIATSIAKHGSNSNA